MEPNEIKSQLDRIQAEVKAEGLKSREELANAVKDRASTADVEAITSKFETYCEDAEKRSDELKGALEAMGITMKGYMEAGQSRTKSLSQNLAEALTAKQADFEAMKTGEYKGGKISITLKTVGNQLTTNILPAVSTAVPYSLAELETGITRIARRRPFIRELLNARPISTMYAAWAEQTGIEGAAAAVAEGADKPQIDFDVQEATRKVEKIAAFVKTSRENLADVDAMRNFIEEELFEVVNLKFDTDLYSGTGVSPILKGLHTWAGTAAVAGTPFATAGTGVNFANNWDVIAAQIAIMENNNFSPDTLLLNPMDYALMSMIKDSSGIYIMHPLATAEGQRAAGIRVVTNPLVATGTFDLFDSSRVSLRMREDFNILVGYDGNDLTKNLVTFVGEMRGVLYVKTNYALAVVKGTFTTLAAAMETA